MYAPTTLVPARDFWQYCFFLPLAACSRVLLLLLLSCHETCKCSFCFCVLLLLSSWISQEFYPVVWWMNWTCWDLIDGKLLCLALGSVENELNIFCTSQILYVFGGLEWAALGCSSSSQQQPSPAASSTSNPNDNSSRAAARGGAKCCLGWAPLRGDRTLGSDGCSAGGPRGAKPRGLIPSFPN